MLVYPSSIDLSSRTLGHLARQLAARQREIGTRWRRLPVSRQALLALAHLRCGDTYTQLAAGFGIGIATVYRNIREAIEVLAALAPTLTEVMMTATPKAYVILDRTLLPIDRIAADTVLLRQAQAARHERPSPHRSARLLAVGIPCPARSHPRSDRRPQPRNHRRPRRCGTQLLGRQGIPRRRPPRPRARPGPPAQAMEATAQQQPCQDPSRRRAGHGRTEGWRLLRKPRCSTNRITDIVKAVVVLHHAPT